MKKTWLGLMLVFVGVVGFVAAREARGDASSPTMMVYARNDNSVPQYRLTSNANGVFAWDSAQSMPQAPGWPHWMVLKDCPTRTEIACAMFDQNRKVSVVFYESQYDDDDDDRRLRRWRRQSHHHGHGNNSNGYGHGNNDDDDDVPPSWGSVTTLATNVGVSYTQRAMDLVYENAGDLLVAYWKSSSSRIGYCTTRRGYLRSERTFTLPVSSGGNVKWLSLTPFGRSNRVLLLALDTNRALHGVVWSGNRWKTVTTLTTNFESDQYEAFAAGFEAGVTKGVVTYGKSGQSSVYYRTVVADTISSTEHTLAGMGSNTWRWMRLAPHPTNGSVLLVGLNASSELWAAMWNGTSWSGQTQLATQLQHSDRRNFDVSWQPDGTKAVVHYGKNSDGGVMQYRVWNGATWAAEATAANVGDNTALFALLPDDSGTRIYGLSVDAGNDLCSFQWTGSQWGSSTELEASAEGEQVAQSFMIVAPVTGATQEPDEDPIRVVEWQEIDPG